MAEETSPGLPPAPTGQQGGDTVAEAKSPGFWSHRRNWALVAAGVLVVLAVAAYLFFWRPFSAGVPAVVLESPEPVAALDRGDITVDVRLTDLPEGVYPAASLSAAFDNGKLEFVGVKQGTLQALGGSEGRHTIPLWSVDVAHSNREGQVNTMYLDTTAGAYAYTDGGFAKGTSDIALRLVFRLRESVQPGDRLDVTVLDAVFATTGNAVLGTSLATANQTLRAFHAHISVT